MDVAAIRSWKNFMFYKRKSSNSFFFRKRRDRSNDIFEKYSLLTVYEYHLYELLKFVLKSVIGVHNDSFLNDLFVFQNAKIATRNSDSSLLFEPFCKRKIERFSIRYRACKIFNKLRVLNLIPARVKSCSFSEILAIYHSLKIYLVQKHEYIWLIKKTLKPIPVGCMLQDYQLYISFFLYKIDLPNPSSFRDIEVF